MKKIKKQLKLLILTSIAKSKIGDIYPVLPQLLDRYCEVCRLQNKKEPCYNKTLNWKSIQNKRKKLEKAIKD
ncbi:hypothetical protein [Veillonella intestinalis]|uniref:hypothetical protein n=1 Tax=Veillonella intestinalis TaxID=2941341 RepID=UPI002041690A|nr:hypothetical protein [Veillonella intestinalis]